MHRQSNNYDEFYHLYLLGGKRYYISSKVSDRVELNIYSIYIRYVGIKTIHTSILKHSAAPARTSPHDYAVELIDFLFVMKAAVRMYKRPRNAERTEATKIDVFALWR